MKINSQYGKHLSAYSRKQNNGENSRYIISSPKISFSANPLKVVEGNKIIYKNIKEIMDGIDGVLGHDGYLASQIEKAKKADLKISDGVLELKQEKFSQAFLSTIKYPFVQMPFEIIEAVGKKIQKTPFSSLGDRILNNNFIKSRIEKIEAKNSYEHVVKILDQFCEKEDLFQNDVTKLTEYFKKTTANKITETAKAYASRDERTLNRLVTGGIGAILSAKDMYNISMLEKNDNNTAKKAEKSRCAQEMTRVGLSAGLTFLTLGVFDKYTKGSYILTSVIIAGSTLFSEIVSRIAQHKSLIPLSPEKAKKIAQSQENKKPEQSVSFTKIALNNANKNDKTGKFKDFTVLSNEAAASKAQPQEQKQNPKSNKKTGILAKLLGAAILCSAGYLISYKAKGEYAQKLAKKALLDSHNKEIQEFLDTGDISKLPEKLRDEIIKLTDSEDTFFEKLKDKITKRETDVDLPYLQEKLNGLLASEDSKEIEPIVKFYKEQVEFLRKELRNKGETKYTQKVKRTVASALYEGITKIFKTLYTIFSAPAKLITYIKEKPLKESMEKFDNLDTLISAQADEKLSKKYKKQLSELNTLFKKYENQQDGNQKIAKAIYTHSRNFEKSAETSELANFSRTLVTLIASIFYVNDFRNTVLIESEGENVQRAKEVTNDSISFKLCNFFFNGTLMNLFNSFFNNILNSSLAGATAIAAATEVTNEFLIRQTIARPMKRLHSRDEIIEYEGSKANRKGFAGWWTRNFKKLTGQKSLVEKYENSKK